MTRVLAALLLCVASTVSCDGPHEGKRTFPIVFVVESDPGVRLRGARVTLDGETIGESDNHGIIRARVSRLPGERLLVTHECPEGHEAPLDAKALRLREHLGVDDSEVPLLEVTLRCDPKTRVAVFVVRAKNGVEIPVLLNGRLVAHTNGSGVAHFSAQARPGTDYTVTLDTRAHSGLRPQSPTYLFTLPDAHEIFVVDQSFELKNEAYRRPRRPKITKIE